MNYLAVFALLMFCTAFESGTTAEVQVVQLFANQEWTESSLEVSIGDHLWFAVSPENTVRCEKTGPPSTAAGIDVPSTRLPLVDAKACSLIGKVGKEGPVFPIGLNEKHIVSKTAGRLFLGINDDDFEDNSGHWMVAVRKLGSESEEPGLRTALVIVPAVQQWTSTGLDLASGSHIISLVPPEGRINCDRRPTSATADGVVPFEPELGRPVSNFSACGLIGRVNEGKPFQIGSNHGPFAVDEAGVFYLGINDTTLTDNSGAFHVFVVVY